jgi:hypothetical protein
MRITNYDELHPWRSTGPGPMPTTPAIDASAPAQAVVASTSTPPHHRRSGQRSRQARMEWRRVARAATRGDAPTDGAKAPTGEHAAAGPQFPYGMHNTTATYASSVSTDVVAYEDLPGHHLLAVRNLPGHHLLSAPTWWRTRTVRATTCLVSRSTGLKVPRHAVD